MKTRLNVLSLKIVFLLAAGVAIKSAHAIPNGTYLQYQEGKVIYDCSISTVGSGSQSSGEDSTFQGEFALSHTGGHYSGIFGLAKVRSDAPTDISHEASLNIEVLQKSTGEAEICDFRLRAWRDNQNENDSHYHDLKMGEHTPDGGCSIKAVGGSLSGSIQDETFHVLGGNFFSTESNADDNETNQDLFLYCRILVSIPPPVNMRGGQPISNGSPQSN